ncbi:MAG: hypothetical protein R5N81_09050 [Cutibacterium granulosum]|uniref:restriction endonuclease subunit S n=1 Tax=Cutibacterium granulosum TaxID=33011 RepID=UPI002B234761|nr:hypothetical protein [Cutibacterium granulosum]MEA5636321.1 hypothetical protein [Cutibacterium granulosum]
MKTVPLRYLAEINPPSPELDAMSDNAEIEFLPLEAVWSDERADQTRVILKHDASGYTRFNAGDIVSPKVTPTFQAGRSMITKHAGVGTTELHILRARDGVDSRWICYALKSNGYLQEGVTAFQGVAGLQRVPANFVATFRVANCSIEDQRRIADFLDDRVTRIDRIIAARRQQITHEDDAATALLADRLLTGTAVVPLRRFIQDDRMGLWGVDPGASEMNVRVARVADFVRSNFKLGDATTVRSAPVSHVKARTLVPGDVLLERSGGTPLNPVGCPAFVSEIDGPTVCSNFISRLRPDEDTDGRYLSLLLGALYATRQQEPHSTQTTGIQNLNPASYFSVLAPCPSFMNQKKISREVDTELHGIRQQQNDLGRIIALLEEYKQSLITAAVNGEFDVTAASTKVPG